MSVRVLLATVLACSLPTAVVHGQTPETVFCKQPGFRIPFQIDPGEQPRLREVQLLLLDEASRTWRAYKTVGPDQRFFSFRAERDGVYTFLVRTLDAEGKYFPEKLEGAAPGLRVIVDTQAPVATLRVLPARQDQVGVEWEVRDDNLDIATLQIDYRSQGTGNWLNLTVEPQASGQRYWMPQVRGPYEVRLRVRDRAENQGSAYLLLPAAGSGEVANRDRGSYDSSYANPPSNKTIGHQSAPAKIVNSTDIKIDYKLEDVGPSGVSIVELWYTRDGRSWQRYGEDPDKAPPFDAKLPGEGVYGLTLVVKSGVGIGDRPPQTGDPPQMWIEVDLTRPNVQIQSVEAGRGHDSGTLTVTWRADDKNIAPQPITIYYAEQAEGPWTTMAGGLENTGRYNWRIPPNAPFRFFVRVEALDKGGNIGRADTKQPVIVDLSTPKGRLIGVDSVQANPKPQ
jgi:hypothetical protein